MKKSVLVAVILAGVAASGALVAGGVEPVQPISPPKGINLGMVELGKKLFFDPRLSKSGFISCNSCHNLSMGGTNNLKTSIGHEWQKGSINVPTVLNASLSIAQFWDGRAPDLKVQAEEPIANPVEMASTHQLSVETLESIPAYRLEFKQVFGTDRITIDAVATAIAEFEKTLVTPNSRFDQYLLGKTDALNAEELEGYKLFKSSGCVACHNGPAIGGNTFQKMGLVAPYKTDNPSLGRYAVTGRELDRHYFKVPTLRNVELTYPYFHDSGASTLPEAVDIMAHVQLGRTFSREENARIVAFLRTLTGELPTITLPHLPKSGEPLFKPSTSK